MFEGKPPFAPESGVWKRGTAGDDSLCPVDWDELKARFAAARDLRREMGTGDCEGKASFDGHFARRIAAHSDRTEDHALGSLPQGKDKDGVNPVDLTNGKSVCHNIGSDSDNGDPTNRGNI